MTAEELYSMGFSLRQEHNLFYDAHYTWWVHKDKDIMILERDISKMRIQGCLITTRVDTVDKLKQLLDLLP